MNIYVSRAVVKNISHFVSTLKNIQGVNINVAIGIRDRIYQSIQYQINKEVRGKNVAQHKAMCWCADGYSPYAWIFDYIVLPVQNIVLIYNMRYDWASKYIKNAKPIREARCLMGRIENKVQYDKLGPYDIVPSNDFLITRYRCDSLKQFGEYRNYVMYSSDTDTYCFMQRVDNNTFFCAKIIPAPELGEKQTKFQAVKQDEIPNIILHHFRQWLHS